MAGWAAGAAVVLGSPLIGDLRQALLRAFPRQYVAIIAGGVILGGALVVAVCLRRIRDDRPRRFAILGLAIALAVVSFALLRSGNPNVDAVEAFHFVEYGVLTLLFFRFGQDGARWETYLQAALATTVVGVADEWFQWFVPGRAGEWRDVLFDLLATACGLLLCLALDNRGRGSSDPPLRKALASGRGSSDPPLRKALVSGRGSLDPPPRRGLALGSRTALVILWLGGFIATVHLGSEIRDPEIGTFRSRFSAARLDELASDRASAWAGQPPPVVGRYGREDQYQAEALWHVRRRNFGMDPDQKGDPIELDIAWRENQILERYFGPVLAAPPAPGTTGHRLAPEQLAAVDAARAHAVDAFVSDAEAMPIYAWPPWAWWLCAVGLAAAAVGAGVTLDRTRRT